MTVGKRSGVDLSDDAGRVAIGAQNIAVADAAIGYYCAHTHNAAGDTGIVGNIGIGYMAIINCAEVLSAHTAGCLTLAGNGGLVHLDILDDAFGVNKAEECGQTGS